MAELRAFDEDGRSIARSRWLLVLSKKLPTLQSHQDFLEPLLDDLFNRMSHLPFTVSAPTGQQVQEAMRPPGPLFALHFLTQEADRIATALRIIQAAPHRKLDSEELLLPLYAVSTVDVDALIELAQSSHRWQSAPHASSPMAKRLGGRLPESIWQRVPVETLDTPENRFVLGAIQQFSQALDALERQTWWPKVSADSRRTLQQLATVMRLFLQDPRFAEVGAFSRPPASSRVLLRKEGYRDLFALWGLFQRSRRPLFGAIEAAMAVKDVATLYEQWVFFWLADALSGMLHETPMLTLRMTDDESVGWNAAADFGAHGLLRYNATRTAYSGISLRPDMLWEPVIGRSVALDAKFRFHLTASKDERWKDDDLVKMHAYRDGLGVRAAVVIYPGDLMHFWPGQGSHQIADLDALIRTDFSGIGAINARPTNGEGK